MASAVDAPHQCAVAMEYELFSASKLPMSYKAAMMKRVNEIKKLTGLRELHADLIPRATDAAAADTVECTAPDGSHAPVLSVENRSSFSDDLVDVAADNNVVNVVPDTDGDNDDITLSTLACELKSSKQSGDNCDTVTSGDTRELLGDIESSSVTENVASDRNGDSLDDPDDDLSSRCNTVNSVIPPRDVDQLSGILVKSGSSSNSSCVSVKTSKSVRISDSPPSISYINLPYQEVYNGATKNSVKVCCVCVF